MSERWYAVQTLPRNEAWAVENIVVKGFQSYWPRYRVAVRGRPNAEKYKSVFPSYVFAQFDRCQDPWRAICTARGVRRILGASEESAVPLPRGFVEMMMTDSESGVLQEANDSRVLYSAGDQLRIDDGPLAGHVGIMRSTEKGRIALLLTLLGRENVVYLPSDRVSYAGAPL